jgi:hypothetical protein
MNGIEFMAGFFVGFFACVALVIGGFLLLTNISISEVINNGRDIPR